MSLNLSSAVNNDTFHTLSLASIINTNRKQNHRNSLKNPQTPQTRTESNHSLENTNHLDHQHRKLVHHSRTKTQKSDPLELRGSRPISSTMNHGQQPSSRGGRLTVVLISHPRSGRTFSKTGSEINAI